MWSENTGQDPAALDLNSEAAAPAGQVTSVGVVALFSALPLIGRAILLHFD